MQPPPPPTAAYPTTTRPPSDNPSAPPTHRRLSRHLPLFPCPRSTRPPSLDACNHPTSSLLRFLLLQLACSFSTLPLRVPPHAAGCPHRHSPLQPDNTRSNRLPPPRLTLPCYLSLSCHSEPLSCHFSLPLSRLHCLRPLLLRPDHGSVRTRPGRENRNRLARFGTKPELGPDGSGSGCDVQKRESPVPASLEPGFFYFFGSWARPGQAMGQAPVLTMRPGLLARPNPGHEASR